jgi:hypothetical protein
MGEPRNVPAVSAIEADESAHGTPAGMAETTQNLDIRTLADFPCCTPVDVPRVGLSHAYNCANSGCRYTVQGRESAPGEMPETLLAVLEQEKRDALLSDLVSAAQDLAQRNLRKSHLIGTVVGFEIRTAGCVECLRPALSDSQPHNADCRTGRVLDLVAALLATPVTAQVDLSLNRKEAVPAEETNRACDGTRPRGLSGCVCLRCGAQRGEWSRKLVSEAEFLGNVLALNECAAPFPTQDGNRVVFVHRCESKLRGVDVLFAEGGNVSRQGGAE